MPKEEKPESPHARLRRRAAGSHSASTLLLLCFYRSRLILPHQIILLEDSHEPRVLPVDLEVEPAEVLRPEEPRRDRAHAA
jgi:hypothetical protein